MRKIREILRLKEEAGMSNRAIAQACKRSNNTVGAYLRRADAIGLHWPLPAEMGEVDLYRQLFPEEANASEPKRPMPDFSTIQKALKKRGVILLLGFHKFSGEPIFN